MTANNASHYPYHDCLIPNLPEETQHQVRDISNYFLRPLDMLLAVISFVCNTVVCITVARTKSLQHPSLVMLCSLAITDLIYSQFSLFMNVDALTHEHMCPSRTPEKTAAAILCNLATLGSLAVISRDRYLAVVKPWWYRSHATKSRAMMEQFVVWLISLVIVFVFYVAHKLEGAFKPLAHALNVLFYCICFIVITGSYLGLLLNKPEIAQLQQIRAVMQREKRMAATVKLILLALLLTFLPALLFPIVMKAKGIDNLQPYGPFVSFLFTLNACLNPLLNLGRNKDMRRAMRVLFRCSQHVETQPQPPPPALPTAVAPPPTSPSAALPSTAAAPPALAAAPPAVAPPPPTPVALPSTPPPLPAVLLTALTAPAPPAAAPTLVARPREAPPPAPSTPAALPPSPPPEGTAPAAASAAAALPPPPPTPAALPPLPLAVTAAAAPAAAALPPTPTAAAAPAAAAAAKTTKTLTKRNNNKDSNF